MTAEGGGAIRFSINSMSGEGGATRARNGREEEEEEEDEDGIC